MTRRTKGKRPTAALGRNSYVHQFSEKLFLSYLAKQLSKSERKAIGWLPSNIHIDAVLKPDDLWQPLETLRFPRARFDAYLHNLENALVHLRLYPKRTSLHQVLYISGLYLFCIRNTNRGMDVASDAIRLSLERLSDSDLETKIYFADYLEWLGRATRKPYWNQHLIELGIAMLDLLISAQRLQGFCLRFKRFEATDLKALRPSSYSVSFPADWLQLKQQITEQSLNQVQCLKKVAL